MRDIDPLSSYSQGNEAEFRKEIVKDVARRYSTDQDLFINMDQRLVLQSPDGNWWRVQVTNAGLLTQTLVTP